MTDNGQLQRFSALKRVLSDEWRLLTLRGFKPDTNRFGLYLGFGLAVTWLCGIGRYWDNPRAELWQHLGLGSLAYVFLLSAILWMILVPLRPANWRYHNVLLFVSLTSPPALLYAIPVERFMTLENAQLANVWFLAVVAAWRVAMLFQFLRNAARLPLLCAVVATLLPLTLIVATLAALNLEHVVFKLMAGLEEHERSANDRAYFILLVITYFSLMSAPVLLGLYAWLSFSRRRHPAT